jgi:hypothetical protein
MATQLHVQALYRELAGQWREMAEASDQSGKVRSGSKEQAAIPMPPGV